MLVICASYDGASTGIYCIGTKFPSRHSFHKQQLNHTNSMMATATFTVAQPFTVVTVFRMVRAGQYLSGRKRSIRSPSRW